MPESGSHPSAPTDWGSAFAGLPLADAPADAWPRIAARIDARRRRWPWWLATAAALLLAFALPWTLRDDAPRPAQPATRPVATSGPATLADLYAESARLEALLAYARDERVASGSAAALSAQLDDRLAAIDAALMQPRLSTQQQQALWTQRVAALRTLAGFESTRRWLSAHGERYDGALARVD